MAGEVHNSLAQVSDCRTFLRVYAARLPLQVGLDDIGDGRRIPVGEPVARRGARVAVGGGIFGSRCQTVIHLACSAADASLLRRDPGDALLL